MLTDETIYHSQRCKSKQLTWQKCDLCNSNQFLRKLNLSKETKQKQTSILGILNINYVYT